MKSDLSYDMIKKAISGDAEAVNRIVSIYEPYINTLSSQTLYDEDGNEYIGLNVPLKEHLTSKLMDLINGYKLI